MDDNLKDWLLYKDRDKYSPVVNDTAVIRSFQIHEISESDQEDWRREQWAIRAILVQNSKGPAAFQKFHYSLIEVELGWSSLNKFNFGDRMKLEGIPAESFYIEYEHPITNELIVDLRQDFVRYHGLVQTTTPKGIIYKHPIENMTIIEILTEKSKYFSPMPRIAVHIDFLRDFLAARKLTLIICQASDRFANASSQEAFGIDTTPEHSIEPGLWLQHDIGQRNGDKVALYRARVTMWRNFLVLPYGKPKVQQNPWPHYGLPIAASRSEFIIDSQGNTATLDDSRTPPFLYFQRDVLRKFINTPNYTVFFHMRHWGAATHPHSETVDVGINSHGFVTAFTQDIKNLSLQDQAYWSSFSCRPIGEVCHELFETRMQNKPPNAPGVLDIINTALSLFETAFRHRFGDDVLNPKQPMPKDLAPLTIGPLSDSYVEILPLAKILYEWTVERIHIELLKKILNEAEVTYDKDIKQIKLLKLIYEKVIKVPLEDITYIDDKLVALNLLRLSDAHPRTPDFETVIKKMGCKMKSSRAIDMWDAIINNIENALSRMTQILNDHVNLL